MDTMKQERNEKEAFRILLIEDDPNIALLINANMRKAKLSLQHAWNGNDGLRVFEGTAPHLVLLDLMLPDSDGYEICRRIRAISNVPIIMLTARTEPEDQMCGFKAGADDYVTKPFDPALLTARIIASLRRYYRYGAAPTGTGTETDTSDWTTCRSCHYMGPREKFEVLDERFQMKQICPHCAALASTAQGKIELLPV